MRKLSNQRKDVSKTDVILWDSTEEDTYVSNVMALKPHNIETKYIERKC